MGSICNNDKTTRATCGLVFVPPKEKGSVTLYSSDMSLSSIKEPIDQRGTERLGNAELSGEETFSAPKEEIFSNSLQNKEITQHMLINEAFFIDPIRKFLHSGHFPFKLLINCLIIIFLILIAVLYHTPESIASEQQRKAVIYQFLGDDYLGKDKGDIVSRPTVYLHDYKSVLNDIKKFVMLYYLLSNTSISELKYYYNSRTDDKAKVLQQIMGYIEPEQFDCIYKMLEVAVGSPMKASNDVFDYNCVFPVSIEFDTFTYSSREHWGPSPVRHFTGELTDKNPLGVFSDDYCNYKEEDDCEKCGNDKYNTQDGILLSSSKQQTIFDYKACCKLNNNSYVKTICAPRYDDITGRYFSPCRRLRKKNSNNNNSSEGNEFYFLLIENVRKLSLTASMRHVSDVSLNNMEANSGFKSTIYHWKVEKSFLFHPGGLVEATLDVSFVTRHMYPYLHLRFFLVFGLLLLAIFDIFLRFRALRRLWHCNKRTLNLKRSQLTERQSDCTLQKSNKHFCDSVATSQSTSLSDYLSENKPFLASSVQKQNAQKATKMEKQKESNLSKMGSLLPETTYTDIHDVWREHMMNSKGRGWHYIALVADVLTLIYVQLTVVKLFGIFKTQLYVTIESILLGLIGMLYFLGLLSYIRYFPKTYFAVRAARHVISRLFFFVLSIAPIYVGFAFFFCIVFGPQSNGEFGNIGFSLISLYFMMFGDAIIPAIQNAEGSFYSIVTLLASLMTMVFILFFMMTMLNFAMSIIQHEWSFLRRRFGACLSANNVLFKVRTRDQVRAEALEAIVTNLELLVRIRSGDEFVINDSSDCCFVDNSNSDNNGDDKGTGGCDNNKEMCGKSDEKDANKANDSFVFQREVASFYRRRMDELTEGLLEEND